MEYSVQYIASGLLFMMALLKETCLCDTGNYSSKTKIN